MDTKLISGREANAQDANRLTLEYRQGGLFGITDPDLNIDIAEHGATPALEHEAWERLSNETKFRHERRKITILLKLLG